MKMKAVVIHAEKSPKPGYVFDSYEREHGVARDGSRVWKNARHEISEVDVPRPGPKEVLIKVKACGICGSDVHTYSRDGDGYIRFAWFTKFPNIPGHEFCGEVVEVGRDVRYFKPGDPVTAEEMQYCSECEACKRYHYNQCRNLKEPGSTIPGGLAEYVAVEEKYVWSIKDIIDAHGSEEGYRIGALVEPTGISYHGTIIRSGGVRPGQYGAVYGTGPIGLGCIALMKIAGLSKIFAFEIGERRRAMAEGMGADYVFNPLELAKAGKTSSEVIMALTDGWGADLQIECAGKPHLLYPQMDEAAAFGGRIVNIAHSPQNRDVPVNMARHMFNGGSVAGSNGSAGNSIFRHSINVLASKRVDFADIITRSYDLDHAIEAIVETQKSEAGKILVVME